MKKIITIVFIICFMKSFAQQDSQYTQYMYNTMSINPGYTGTRGVMSALGLYRTQWVGVEGAPKTGSLSLETPISYKGQGLGIRISNDKIGPSDETNIGLSYSYPIKFSEDLTLSLGVVAEGNFLKVDYNKLSIFNSSDAELTGVLSQFTPNIGAGAYFHTKKWYAGLSVPRFLETEFYDDIQTSVAKEKMHFYVMGGYVFDLNENLKLKPAAMVKAVSGAPLSVDVTANVLVHDKLTLGVAYRWSAAVSGMVGFQITDALHIGYAYDHDTKGLGNYNSGSHEIFLRFDVLSASKNKIMTPRFF